MPVIESFSEAITAFGVPRESNAYAKAAQRLYADEGRIEIDDQVVVSEGDEGAYVMAWVWVPDSALQGDSSGASGDPTPAGSFVTSQFRNHYKCPKCDHVWSDVWSAQCDDDCPACGTRHVSPHKSDDV